jgi:nucleotide-binding universal stress UspA family protein
MKKILVPTDLSEVAERGLKLAVEIGIRCQASVHVVNFTKHPVGQPFNSAGEVDTDTFDEDAVFTLQMLHARNKKLQHLADEYESPEVPIEISVVDDKFKTGLPKIVTEENIDLIVMGTTGEENINETFSGNHTEQTINNCGCPVISVRDGFSVDNFKNIVVGVTVITDNQLAEGLAHVRFISDCFDSHVHLVHVRDKAKDSNVILDEYFTRLATVAGIKKFSVMIFDSDDIAKTIMAYGREIHAGLITLIRTSQDGFLRVFSKSITHKVVKEEGGPVFTLNLKKGD